MVYGTSDELSDSDYILVHKRSMLSDGSFKQNAQTNEDEDITNHKLFDGWI